MDNSEQGHLFEDAGNGETWLTHFDEADIAVMIALHSNTTVDLSILTPNARNLYELSVNAFEAITHARMSERPITAEITRYEQKILEAACVKTAPHGDLEYTQRQAANTAAADRGDPDTRTVLDAAYKVWHEIHRLMGLLRFCPNEDGIYVAHCEPDHFILPALGPHFKERFGETPWAIIDKKRHCCVVCFDHSLKFLRAEAHIKHLKNPQNSEWENLWRHYHKTINNESRNNPGLQRRFMPQRYWKYLTEFTQ